MQQTTVAEVRLDAGRAARFSASVRSTGGFDRLPRTRCAICRCSRRPKGRSWSQTIRNPGNVGYIRRVEKQGEVLANIEIATIPMVKDPWKELNPLK
jgi:hypothetical protein